MFNLFKINKKVSTYHVSKVESSWNNEGFLFKTQKHTDVTRFLWQLVDDGFASTMDEDGIFKILWNDFYQINKLEEYKNSLDLLSIPSIEAWKPALASKSGLTDLDFKIWIDSWKDPEGITVRGNVELNGAVLSKGQRMSILPEVVWHMLQAIADLCATPPTERSEDSNKRQWSRIRKYAVIAKADLADFLQKTVVLSPERLRLDMRKIEIGKTKVIELLPTFDGCPPCWIDFFDKFSTVPLRYEIPDGQGITHIMLSPEVRAVLSEIRKMPARRVAGNRAEAFIRNPFAILGENAEKVIDPEQFERSRETAGIYFFRFVARVQHDVNGYPYSCYLLLVPSSISTAFHTDVINFENKQDLCAFLKLLDARIQEDAVFFSWKGYDIEILGDTLQQSIILHEALTEMEVTSTSFTADLLDLSHYSERIEGFGIEKPYYSPFIEKNTDINGWFPETLEATHRYEKNGVDELTTQSFGHQKIRERIERKGLVVKANVDTLDYAQRRGTLQAPIQAPELPSTLKPDVRLKDYQLAGVAWLQHLWWLSPKSCGGALLADDMGLGKTIQLLTFIASILEIKTSQKKPVDPFLIVAPVSLLENWKKEISKFFAAGTMRVLTLYGTELSKKRLPKKELDDALLQEGITNLLKSGWLGDCNVVLTTYETLRDLEFSLARQHWSVVICDEAQKIKNPNALVTRAAKKQNARLRIACTGTPVENTLADLWCLFDFVQPGLLGTLKNFGEQYRKPIEMQTEDEKDRIEKLRDCIAPQFLRRTKLEVAKNLPKKIEVDSCKSLLLSPYQRHLYTNSVATYKENKEQSPIRLLHYLRRLCSDPQPQGRVLADSPKMQWLLKELAVIERKKEKVIIFCEFRDLQRILQCAIYERFNIEADIINGDTSTNSANAQNRQLRIDDFQKKLGFSVILLSPLAVGFGVNIQAANHVVHFTRTWNPAKEDQATDRAYRIGQEKDVYVYYPIVTAHDFVTFDKKLDQLLNMKRELSFDILNGSGDIGIAEFGDLKAPDGDSAFGKDWLNEDDVGKLDADSFEAFCAALWKKQGFGYVYRTPKTGDGGIDVVAIQGKDGVLIQCKSSSVQGKAHGWDAVKEVSAGSHAYEIKHNGIKFNKLAVTNQRFNSNAHCQAQSCNVGLLEAEDLARLLQKYPIKHSDLFQFIPM